MNDALLNLLLSKLVLTAGLTREQAMELRQSLFNSKDQDRLENLTREINTRNLHRLWPASPEKSD